MKKIYVVLVLCFMALNSIAQSFQDLKDKKQNNPFLKQGVKLFFRYTHLKGKYTDALSAPTVNIGLRKDKINIGGIRYRFENPYLGDGIFTIARGIKRINEDRVFNRSEQSITSGFVGWHQAALNVKSSSRFIISPGISLGDALIATKRATNSQSGSRVTDPAGYYFFVGPYVLTSYLINNKMWLDAYANYDITFSKVANPKNDYVANPDYPLPGLLTLGADLYTTSKLFGGLRFVRLMDSGINKDNGSRIDVSLGLVF